MRDKLGNFLAEFSPQLLQIDISILDRVMKESCGHYYRRHMEFSKDHGYGQAMVDIGFP
jgi:hypothetical protein